MCYAVVSVTKALSVSLFPSKQHRTFFIDQARVYVRCNGPHEVTKYIYKNK